MSSTLISYKRVTCWSWFVDHVVLLFGLLESLFCCVHCRFHRSSCLLVIVLDFLCCFGRFVLHLIVESSAFSFVSLAILFSCSLVLFPDFGAARRAIPPPTMAPIKNDTTQHIPEQLLSFPIATSFARRNEGGYSNRHLPDIDSSRDPE